MSDNNREFSRYTIIDSQPSTGEGAVASRFMANVFMWMFVALGISTIIAVLFAYEPAFSSLLYDQFPQGIRLTGLGIFVSFAPIIFVLVMSFAFSRLSAPLLTLFLLLFAASMGMKEIEVMLKGPGAGRESAVRGLVSAGLYVTAIRDVTPIAHNGCRPRKRRRV